jgi:hypothetical protein
MPVQGAVGGHMDWQDVGHDRRATMISNRHRVLLEAKDWRGGDNGRPR